MASAVRLAGEDAVGVVDPHHMSLVTPRSRRPAWSGACLAVLFGLVRADARVFVAAAEDVVSGVVTSRCGLFEGVSCFGIKISEID